MSWCRASQTGVRLSVCGFQSVGYSAHLSSRTFPPPLCSTPASLNASTLVDFERVWVDRLLFVIHNQQHLARFNQAQDWQAAPRAPLSAALYPDTAAGVSFNKLGPGDF